MPFVEINTIKGVFNQAQKEEMIKKVTNAMVSVEGENMRSVTWVVVREIESGDWAIGGEILRADHVKAMAAERK